MKLILVIGKKWIVINHNMFSNETFLTSDVVQFADLSKVVQF